MEKRERAAVGIVALFALLAALFVAGLLAGCSSTGVRVVASSASYTNIGDINWDEYKIPVLSIYLGPKATVWINKDYTALRAVEVSGTVTNETAALAIYDAKEGKTLAMRLEFDGRAWTNAAPAKIEAAATKAEPTNAVPVQLYLQQPTTNAPDVMLTNAAP